MYSQKNQENSIKMKKWEESQDFECKKKVGYEEKATKN